MYDAVILAGGRARRLGGAQKAQLRVGGVRLLDLALRAVRDAAVVVVAGPEQPVEDAPLRARLRWCREEPAGAGPVAAVATALGHTTAPRVVLLACDQPEIAPAIPLLLAAVPPGGVARLVDRAGRANHLAAAWDRDALARSLTGLATTDCAAMRDLVVGVPAVDLLDEAGWGRDCDTPDDLARARDRQVDSGPGGAGAS